MQAYEYWEEYVFLKKAIIGMEFLLCKNSLSKSIFYTKYSLDEINEGKECLLKFWLRQIQYYNSLLHMEQPDYYEYLPNMFDIDTLHEELLENILYVQCQILEAYWTINFVQDFISLDGSQNKYHFEEEEQRMEFYNMVYEQYQKQILDVYREAYSMRRQFIISRAIPCDLGYHLYWNDVLLT